MGLLANGFRDAIGVYQFYGAGTVNGGYPSTLNGNFALTGRKRNITAGQGITDDTVGIPYGYRNPGAWVMPQKAGALSAHNIITGAGDISPLNLAGGLNAEAALSGAGDMTGTGALIVSLVAALTGSGTISSASAQAFLNLAAALAGAGDLAGAATAIGHAAAALSGSGAASATATALGELAAAITVTGDLLSTSNVGAAVWAAVATVNNIAGTMGQKLNAAGSAGDPWVTDLPGAYTGSQAGALLDAMNTLLAELHRIHGLEIGTPLAVTATSRKAGDLTQTVGESSGTVTVTRT